MQVTPKAIEAAYSFLSKAAFYDMPLPRSRPLFVARPMRDDEGCYFERSRRMELNSHITNPQKLLRVVAHEMCHAVLHESGGHWDGDHGQQFKELANIICKRMGWRKGTVL